MATLDDTLRGDVQTDTSIGSDQAVFTNSELDRFYTRADSDYDKTVYFVFRALWADAAKLHNYAVANAREDEAQVFDHIEKLMREWYQIAFARSSDQVALIGVRVVPPRDKDRPNKSPKVSGPPYDSYP